MEVERGERSVVPVELTSNQAKIKKQVLGEFGSFFRKEQKLIVLQGLPGVGKSMVLESLAMEAPKKKFKAEDPDNVVEYLDRITADKDCVGGVMAAGIEWRTKAPYSELDERKIKMVEVTVPGMDNREIERFVASDPTLLKGAKIPKEVGVKYSLGIPVLARRLFGQATSEEEAVNMAAEYLVENIRGSLLNAKTGVARGLLGYFRMEIPQTVIEKMVVISTERREKSIEENFNAYVQKAVEKIGENLALPRTEETTQMYIRSLINPPESVSVGSWRRIEILACGLTPKIFEMIKQNLGFLDGRSSFDNCARVRAFKAENDRMAMALITEGQIEAAYHGPRSGVQIKNEEKFEKRAREGGLMAKGEGVGRVFYFEYFDHGNISSKAAKAGFMVETLLQNLGVSYYAVNTYAGKEYRYVPAEKRLVMTISEQTGEVLEMLAGELPKIKAKLMARYEYMGEEIDDYLAKKPDERELRLGDVDDAKLVTMEKIVREKKDKERDEERKKFYQNLWDEIEWSRGDKRQNINMIMMLDGARFETVEALRELLFGSQGQLTREQFLARALDLATDYLVIKKLLRELEPK